MPIAGRSVADLYAATLREFTDALRHPWESVDSSSGSVRWRLFRRADKALPRQGWKIHVSAAAIEASSLFSHLAPLLVELDASFKIARTVEDIVQINSGDAGSLQVGKVVTIYPWDDGRAAAIAKEVDRIWPKCRGPEVQSDLQFRPGGAVSLRYGIFHSASTLISSAGIYEFALRAADGALVADARQPGGRQSDAAPPAPVPCGPPRPCLVRAGQSFSSARGQYVALALLKDSPRTKIFLSVEAGSLRTVICKVGVPGVAGDERGLDVSDKLRKEFQILSALAACPGLAPIPIEWIEEEWPISLLEDMRGDLLSELPRGERIECLPALADSIARLHRAGFVHGDIKLENAIRRGPGKVGLIDFELAEPVGDASGRAGTTGYLAPEVSSGSAAEFSRDVFALGGCVAEAVLGLPLGLLPAGVGRLRALVALEGAAAASALVDRLAASDPAARPSAEAAAAAISVGLAPSRKAPRANHEFQWLRRASADAASLVDRYAVSDSRGMRWRNEHFMSSFVCEGLNIGAAGIVLGLVTVDQALGRTDFSRQIDGGAQWLSSRPAEPNSAGLFTGNAGVAVTLAVAGRRLGKEEYILASRKRIEHAALDSRETDLFSGSAGVLFACCLLREIVGEDWPLELAESAFRAMPVWGSHYLGCAHGSAGIAMAHAIWGRRAGRQDAVDTAMEVFHKLFAQGRTAKSDALRMTLDGDKAHAPGTWCHGVAGYLWCILQGFGDHPDLRSEIDWAIQAVTDSAAAGTPTYCHGLAGRLELWRMLAAMPRCRDAARVQAEKAARALRIVHHKMDGRVTWCSDNPKITTPDLWIGFLGPATALALYAAGSGDALLSAEWLSASAIRPKTHLS